MKIERSLGTDMHVPSLSLPCAMLLGQRVHVRYTAVSYASVCWSRGTGWLAFVKASVVMHGGFTPVDLCCHSPVSFCGDVWWVYTHTFFLKDLFLFYVYFGCSSYMYVSVSHVCNALRD